MMDRVPDQSFVYCFIFMPVDVPGGGHRRPIDFRVPAVQLIGKPPGCFRDDLEGTNYRVNRLSVRAKSLEIESSGERRSRPRVTLTDTTGMEWFETKSDEWAYEKEWRMMRVLQDAEFRLEAVPHPICLFSFPPDAVVEIIVGLRSSEEFRDRLRTVSKGFSNAKLFQAHEHSSEYALLVKAS